MLDTVKKFKLLIKFHCLEDKTNKTLITVLVITFNTLWRGSRVVVILPQSHCDASLHQPHPTVQNGL